MQQTQTQQQTKRKEKRETTSGGSVASNAEKLVKPIACMCVYVASANMCASTCMHVCACVDVRLRVCVCVCVCVFSSPCLTKYSLSRNYLALGAEANGGAQNVHKTYHVGVLLLMDYAGCPCSSCANYCKLFTPFHNSPNTGS